MPRPDRSPIDTGVQWLRPDWPAATNVYAGTSLRGGGVSTVPYASLNLGLHVGDDPHAVAENRRRLGLPAEPRWLTQIHSTRVIDADASRAENFPPEADGAFSSRAGTVCAVMTADCLPLLLCDRPGTRVAAVHAGWRGLADGAIEAGVMALGAAPTELLAWLGPAIGAAAYEVGDEVRAAFVAHDPAAGEAFTAAKPRHWMMDIYALARQRLAACGVHAVYGGTECTHSQAEEFYSYRRDGTTGRMVTAIWFDSR